MVDFRGRRVLQGAEWDLFREGLSSLWDDVEAAEEEDGPGTTGMAFSTNSRRRIPGAPCLGGQGFDRRRQTLPELTELSEGTVAAIFAQIRYHIEVEIDSRRGARLRVLREGSITPPPGHGARRG